MFPYEEYEDKAIILYDGLCILCNGFVQFLLKRDRKDRFRFTPIQADRVADWLEQSDAPGLDEDTVMLWYRGVLYTKSEAAFAALGLLPFPWHLFKLFRIIPRSLSDRIYDWIAKNRYDWFGQKDHCPLPTPGEQEKFIDWPSNEQQSGSKVQQIEEAEDG